jgi:hypothetical protein
VVQPEGTSAPAALTANSGVFATLVQDLLRVVGFPLTSYKGLVDKPKLLKAKANPVPAKATGVAENTQSQSCTIGFKKDFDDKTKPSPVKFRGRVIGQVASSQQAQQMARQLEQGLSFSMLSPADIQPALVKGLPVIKVGDRVLLSLGSNSEDGECKPELLALTWVNNLRAALAEEPLSLVNTQEKMLNLETTEQIIEGMASWYGPYFHGRQTATGEIFDQNDFTAAHQTLPFGTYLKVTNLLNGRSVIVRVNDRGPYVENRTLDLSHAAARYLGAEEEGVIPVEAVVMEPAAVQEPPTQTVAKL